jgi:type II secretory pathway pseudopilin PulG
MSGRNRGLTLLELLISLSMVVVITLTTTRAYITSLDYNNKLRNDRNATAARNLFEDEVSKLIRHAWLSTSTTNQKSYFIGGQPTVLTTTGGTNTTGATGSTTGSSSGSSAGGANGAYGTPNTMVFTAAGLPLPGSYLASNDDFNTDNQNYGPVGGIQEIELSQTAVGPGGQGKTGLFLRTQIPADNDPTQGGNEELLSADVTQIGFEFFDGANWDQSWDNRAQTPAPGHLPAAVRVTYRFKGDDTDHVFIVMIPASDVNYLNPVTVTG